MRLHNSLKRAYHLLLQRIHARSRYRLFVRTSLQNLSRHTQRLVALTDYYSSCVNPIVINAPFGKSVLVLAPHQDDEAIGCGGAIALQAQSGLETCIVILQDGASEHTKLGITREAMTTLRNEESRKAAAIAGVPEPVFLNYRSLRESHAQAVKEVSKLIRERKVDAIFTPFLLDSHSDHRATNAILAEALGEISWNVRVFGYEVWGLVIPNVIVIIDEVIGAKTEMIRSFALANSAVNYIHSTIGLNMYRSRLLPVEECQYAECYFEAEKREFIFLVSSLRKE